MSGGSSRNRRTAKRASVEIVEPTNKQAKEKTHPRQVQKPRRTTRLNWQQAVVLYLKRLGWAWSAFVVVAIIVGFVSAIYAFRPQVSVTPGVTLRGSNPFTTMFTVHNTGGLSLYSLKFGCYGKKVTFGGSIEVVDSWNHVSTFDVPELRADEKTSTPCYVGFGAAKPLESADIAIVVSYRSSFVPWRTEHRSRFIATRDADGTYHWIEMAETSEYESQEGPTP